MPNHQPPSPSLLNMIIKAALAEGATPKGDPPARPEKRADIVDRRDEGGTRYPGDFPNPTGKDDGCF